MDTLGGKGLMDHFWETSCISRFANIYIVDSSMLGGLLGFRSIKMS